MLNFQISFNRTQKNVLRFISEARNINLQASIDENQSEFPRRLKEIDKNIERVKRSILCISTKCDPFSALKIGYLNHELKISKSMHSGYVDLNKLMTRKSIYRDKEQKSAKWYLTRHGIAKLPYEYAGSYPFLSRQDRINPPKELDPRVFNVLRSIHRYWDGTKWVAPTMTPTQAKKYKEKYIKQGLEWPEMIKNDMTLNKPFNPKASHELRHSVYNSKEYTQYIRRVVYLQRKIAKAHWKLRSNFSDLRKRVLSPMVHRMGYTHKYMKFAKYRPEIRNAIFKILTDPKYNRIQNITKYSLRSKALLMQRLSIWKLKAVRIQLYKHLLALCHERNMITNKIPNFSTKSPLHKKSSIFLQFRLQKESKLLLKQTQSPSNPPTRNQLVHRAVSQLNQPQFLEKSKVNPDTIKKFIPNNYIYNKLRNRILLPSEGKVYKTKISLQQELKNAKLKLSETQAIISKLHKKKSSKKKIKQADK